MDTVGNCSLSNTSTPIHLLPPLDSNTDSLSLFTSINGDTTRRSGFIAEQFRLEREIADQSSMKTQDSFTTTYSSIQIILSQMQVQLAAVFLQETEYLKQREERFEEDEKSAAQRAQQLKTIRMERKQLEKEFTELQDRIEAAVVHVINYRSDGEEILRLLFSESRQIDEEFSGLLSQTMASIHRCRTMIYAKIDTFSQQSVRLQSDFTDRENVLRHTQASIISMLKLMNTLNDLNIEHSQDITMAITDFERQHHKLLDLSETTKCHWNIEKEINDIRQLEDEKFQLEQELLEHTILLENICTIIANGIAD